VVDGGGGALLPGLHDHHCHLLATAAAAASVPCGPPHVTAAAQLWRRLRHAASRSGGWVRGVNYDESVAGPLDRDALDAAVSSVPVRVQHRSGALWVLNSAAIAALALDTCDAHGVERDGDGRPTGRLWRMDAWLGERLAAREPPDLASLGRALASVGITGVTDATVDLTPSSAGLLAGAHAAGDLPQRLLAMAEEGPLPLGPRKLVVADDALPGWDELKGQMIAAREADRAVAVHSVTRESLLLTLAVLAEIGARPEDRIEHAAVAPPEAVAFMAKLGVAVVTQPSLVALRGDDYLGQVERSDAAHLWPYASLVAAGVSVAASSDAPYGALDPWATLRAAALRETPSGRVLGAGERVSAATALSGYLSEPMAPGRAVRRITPGGPADLVLLDAPLDAVLADPVRDHVRLTMIAGEVVYGAD
jgi:predicted amidohydrolase YtcJ